MRTITKKQGAKPRKINNGKQNGKTIEKLLCYANNGRKKELYWSLTEAQVENIKNMGFHVEPSIYEIKTKKMSNLRFVNEKILKDIHFANKRGKQFFTKSLNEDEKTLLSENGINFRVVKYLIKLK